MVTIKNEKGKFVLHVASAALNEVYFEHERWREVKKADWISHENFVSELIYSDKEQALKVLSFFI